MSMDGSALMFQTGSRALVLSSDQGWMIGVIEDIDEILGVTVKTDDRSILSCPCDIRLLPDYNKGDCVMIEIDEGGQTVQGEVIEVEGKTIVAKLDSGLHVEGSIMTASACG